MNTEQRTYIVGRISSSTHCDIGLPEYEQSISRRHLELTVMPDGRCYIVHLGPGNTTSFQTSDGSWLPISRDYVDWDSPLMLGDYRTSARSLISMIGSSASPQIQGSFNGGGGALRHPKIGVRTDHPANLSTATAALPPKSTNILIAAAILSVAAAIALVIVGLRKPSPGSVLPVTSASPIPSGYDKLAGVLSHGILTNRSSAGIIFDEAQARAAVLAGVMDLRSLKSSDPQISSLASQGADALDRLLKARQGLVALPIPPDNSAGYVMPILQLGVGLPMGDPSLIASGAGQLAKQYGEDSQNEKDYETKRNRFLKDYESAALDLKTYQLLLPQMAQRFWEGKPALPAAISVEFDGNWNAWTSAWITMENSGNALKNCTIEVTVMGESGESCRNVHYVAHWPLGGKLHARYDCGITDVNTVMLRSSVDHPASLSIRIWSDNGLYSLDYDYPKKERDEDRKNMIKDLVFPKTEWVLREPILGGDGYVFVLQTSLTHPIYDVSVSVFEPNGSCLGKYSVRELSAGGKIEVGRLEMPRNLLSGDKVSIMIGEYLIREALIE
jgi:hypothetical protein